jgi:hypothetical protein
MIWHYTKGTRIDAILEDGFIRPTSIGISKGERPIVWFSTRQDWEPTITAGLAEDGITLEDYVQAAKGLFRIGVADDFPLKTWRVLLRESRMDLRRADGLLLVAAKEGASPDDWRGTFYPVPSTAWISRQALIGNEWTEISNGG